VASVTTNKMHNVNKQHVSNVPYEDHTRYSSRQHLFLNTTVIVMRMQNCNSTNQSNNQHSDIGAPHRIYFISHRIIWEYGLTLSSAAMNNACVLSLHFAALRFFAEKWTSLFNLSINTHVRKCENVQLLWMRIIIMNEK